MTAPPSAEAPWLPMRAFNALATRVPRLAPELPPVDELVRRACAQVPGTGVADLGEGSWRPALTAFRDALRTEAELTPLGRALATRMMVSALVNRLEVGRAVAADPEVARRPVGPALVVVGLPRSGTTLLQHLLSLDPGSRSLLHWEAARPVPSPGTDARADARRVRAAERGSWLVDRLAPQARTLHPTGPRLPTECVSLFVNGFASLELGVLYHVPSYVQWCLEADMAPHYAFYARQLQVLGRHGARERWALKSPAHLLWLEELAAALPESRIVVLHRDPVEVVSSFCELVQVATASTCRPVDPAAIGALWSPLWAEARRRAEAARGRIPADRWVDVEYTDLVADPVGTVAAVYGAFGLPFGDDLAGAIRAHVAAHPRRRSAPALTPATFGLDADAERRRYAAAAAGGRA